MTTDSKIILTTSVRSEVFGHSISGIAHDSINHGVEGDLPKLQVAAVTQANLLGRFSRFIKASLLIALALPFASVICVAWISWWIERMHSAAQNAK